MHEEVENAAKFIIKVMKMGHGNIAQQIGDETLEKLTKAIAESMIEKYTGHWHPQKPNKGSAYRSIRIGNRLDKTIEKAVEKIGLSTDLVKRAFTLELTLWVDPREVSYQMGEKGSVSVLYEKKEANAADSLTAINGQLRRPEPSHTALVKPAQIDPSPSTDRDSESSASNCSEMENVDIGNQMDNAPPPNSVVINPSPQYLAMSTMCKPNPNGDKR